MTNLKVGVKVLLKNPQGKFLIIQRSPVKYLNAKGHWDIVGGRIEPGSTLIENLKREVKEETQLEIIGEPRIMYAQDIIYTDAGETKHVVRISYQGETVGEPVIDPIEVAGYKWVTIEDLKKLDDVDIYFKEIIEKGLINV